MVTSQLTGRARHWRQNGRAPTPQKNSTRPTSTSGDTLVTREVSAASEAHSSMVYSARPVDLSHHEEPAIQHSFAR